MLLPTRWLHLALCNTVAEKMARQTSFDPTTIKLFSCSKYSSYEYERLCLTNQITQHSGNTAFSFSTSIKVSYNTDKHRIYSEYKV